jgi:hypothetical protein
MRSGRIDTEGAVTEARPQGIDERLAGVADTWCIVGAAGEYDLDIGARVSLKPTACPPIHRAWPTALRSTLRE